jgi:hypothetical protein
LHRANNLTTPARANGHRHTASSTTNSSVVAAENHTSATAVWKCCRQEARPDNRPARGDCVSGVSVVFAHTVGLHAQVYSNALAMQLPACFSTELHAPVHWRRDRGGGIDKERERDRRREREIDRERERERDRQREREREEEEEEEEEEEATASSFVKSNVISGITQQQG